MAVPADVAVEKALAATAPEAERVVALDHPPRRPRPTAFSGRLNRRSEAGLDDRDDASRFSSAETAHVHGLGEDLADVGLGQAGLGGHLPIGAAAGGQLVRLANDHRVRLVDPQRRGMSLANDPERGPVAAWDPEPAALRGACRCVVGLSWDVQAARDDVERGPRRYEDIGMRPWAGSMQVADQRAWPTQEHS
jgi:hypothetical protein